MPRVEFIYPDGQSRSVEVPAGESVMSGAIREGLPGIVAECGGVLTCATCHVHVDAMWRDLIPPPGMDETDMLEMVDDYTPASRLSCQVIVTPDLDGLSVSIPPSNL